MSAQIIQFPRKPTTADLCREMAYSVSCSDPVELAKSLEESGFASFDRERAIAMIAHAKSVFKR